MNKKYFIFIILAILVLAILWVTLTRHLQTRKSDIGAKPSIVTENKIRDLKKLSNEKNRSSNRDEESSKSILKTASDFIVAGKKWELMFSDQTLTPLTRQRIKYDLNLIFGHLPRVEIDTIYKPIKLADGRELDRRVRFEGDSRRSPELLKVDGFLCLFRGGSKSEVFVPQAVSDAYVEAFELVKQHEAAFTELDLFLQRMTEIKTHPISNPKDLFLLSNEFKNAEADFAALPVAGFAAAWGGKIYRSASVLDVCATVGTRRENFSKYGDLFAITYTVSGDKLDQLPPLVFKGGKWRFLMLPPPT